MASKLWFSKLFFAIGIPLLLIGLSALVLLNNKSFRKRVKGVLNSKINYNSELKNNNKNTIKSNSQGSIRHSMENSNPASKLNIKDLNFDSTGLRKTMNVNHFFSKINVNGLKFGNKNRKSLDTGDVKTNSLIRSKERLDDFSIKGKIKEIRIENRKSRNLDDIDSSTKTKPNTNLNKEEIELTIKEDKHTLNVYQEDIDMYNDFTKGDTDNVNKILKSLSDKGKNSPTIGSADEFILEKSLSDIKKNYITIESIEIKMKDLSDKIDSMLDNII